MSRSYTIRIHRYRIFFGPCESGFFLYLKETPVGKKVSIFFKQFKTKAFLVIPQDGVPAPLYFINTFSTQLIH